MLYMDCESEIEIYYYIISTSLAMTGEHRKRHTMRAHKPQARCVAVYYVFDYVYFRSLFFLLR